MTPEEVTAEYTKALMAEGAILGGEAVISDDKGVERDRMSIIWVPRDEPGAIVWKAVPERQIDLPQYWTVDLRTPLKIAGGVIRAYSGDDEASGLEIR